MILARLTPLPLAALFALAAPAMAAEDRVDKVSGHSFKDTVKRLEKAIQGHHMMVVARVDHQNMLKTVGTKIRGSQTIEFGKPEMGKMLMPMAPQAGLEMPARIYVFEAPDGKVVVSYRKPSEAFGSYGNPMLSKMGQDMDGMLDGITSEAVE